MAIPSTTSDDVDIRPVQSILDTDLYKLTMQQAVLTHFPDAYVSYKFTNRSQDMRFTKSCVDKIRAHILALSSLALTDEEEQWLAKECPYLKPEYRAHLQKYRFCPKEQVTVEFDPEHEQQRSADIVNAVQEENGVEQSGKLKITVQGRWADVILYEVPLMSIISEAYFACVDTHWTLRGQRALARMKGRQFVQAGIRYSEFGSRRRRSFETHKLVIEGLLQGEKDDWTPAESTTGASASAKGKLVGTSNVHLARLFGLTPVGTMAHEWTMGIAALQGYDNVNLRALQLWDAVYSPPNFQPNTPGHDLTIALTDTFSTRVFWQDLLSSDAGREIAKRWRGLRQDSGDSKAFAVRAKKEYDALDVDAAQKVVIYSDGLDVSRCLELQEFSKQVGIGASFGVGTNLTNDFYVDKDASNPFDADADDHSWIESARNKQTQKSKALNIVIKLHSVNGRNAVKISDDLLKNTGDPEEVRLCKRRFGLDDANLEDRVEDA